MAIFTTLRLTVVLSTILPYTPNSYFTAINVRFLVSSYPFPGPCLSAVICHEHFRVFGRFSSFWWGFRPHRSALPLLRYCRLPPLLCVSFPLPLPELISFSGSAHFPPNVRKLHFLSSPIQLTLASDSARKTAKIHVFLTLDSDKFLNLFCMITVRKTFVAVAVLFIYRNSYT